LFADLSQVRSQLAVHTFSAQRIKRIGNSILPLFARRGHGSGLQLIRRRASRPAHVAPAPGRLRCRWGRISELSHICALDFNVTWL
jgi:hypothetical protein